MKTIQNNNIRVIYDEKIYNHDESLRLNRKITNIIVLSWSILGIFFGALYFFVDKYTESNNIAELFITITLCVLLWVFYKPVPKKFSKKFYGKYEKLFDFLDFMTECDTTASIRNNGIAITFYHKGCGTIIEYLDESKIKKRSKNVTKIVTNINNKISKGYEGSIQVAIDTTAYPDVTANITAK